MRTIEIHEIQNLIETFLRNDSQGIFAIGEMVGCNLLRHISEAVVPFIDFEHILFVSGIQDDVYNGKQFRNHVFWGSLFDDITVDGLTSYNPFRPKVQNPDPEYWKSVTTYMLAPFHLMIIHDAHKIPKVYLDSLIQSFGRKTILIVDPFDHDGEEWNHIDTCVDSFETVSKSIGFARYLYGVDTRSIQKRAKDTCEYSVNIARRSIGKIGDHQFVTLDPYLYQQITDRQKASPMRKGQKIMIVSNKMNLRRNMESGIPHALTYGTLLNIDGVMNKQPRFRLYASKVYMTFTCPLVYEIDKFRTPSNAIQIAPANILGLSDAVKHRYRHIIFVTTTICPNISTRDQYALLKLGQNVTFATTK